MKTKKLILTIIFLLVGIITLNKLYAGNAQEQYLRIAVVNFNELGKPEASYLSLSLAEAVDSFMQKKFKYTRIKPDKVNQEIKRMQNKGLFQKGKALTKRELLELSVHTLADVIVYGSFSTLGEKQPQSHGDTENKKSGIDDTKESKVTERIRSADKTSVVEISTQIYFVNDNKTVQISKIKNKIDSTIFDAVNKVASQVIAEFMKVANKTNTSKSTELKESNVAVLTWLPIYVHNKEIAETPVIYNVLTKPFTDALNQSITSTFNLSQTTDSAVSEYIKSNQDFTKDSDGGWTYPNDNLTAVSKKFGSDYILFGRFRAEERVEKKVEETDEENKTNDTTDKEESDGKTKSEDTTDNKNTKSDSDNTSIKENIDDKSKTTNDKDSKSDSNNTSDPEENKEEKKIEYEEVKYTLELKLFQVSTNKVIGEFTKTGVAVADIKLQAEEMSKSLVDSFKKIELPVSLKIVGLKGKSGELTINGKPLKLNKNGINEFTDKLHPLDYYVVKVKNHPQGPLQTCHLRKASGKIELKPVNNISLICLTHAFTVSGKVKGMEGDKVNFSMSNLDRKEEISVAKDGSFKFKTQVDDMGKYSVVVENQPRDPRQLCSTVNAVGTIKQKAVNDIQINCITVIEHNVGLFVGMPMLMSFNSSTVMVGNQSYPLGSLNGSFYGSLHYRIDNLLPYQITLGAFLNFNFGTGNLTLQSDSGAVINDDFQTNYMAVNLMVFAGYSFVLPYNLEIMPILGAGISYLSITEESPLISGIVPSVSTGFIGIYNYGTKLQFLMQSTAEYQIHFSGDSLISYNIGIGAGWRFY